MNKPHQPLIETPAYPVMESFATLQGEGMHSGRAAFFIRLAGCDVGCVWCDVKESWQVSPEQFMNCKEILLLTDNFRGNIVVITGGEPALYDLGPLVQSLREKGFKVHLETSGAYPLTAAFDWVTVSPKKFKKPLPEVLERADELKVVVYNRSDFEWAETNAAKTNEHCLLYLQPEYSRHNESSALIVQHILDHPEWRFSLQTHKFIGIP